MPKFSEIIDEFNNFIQGSSEIIVQRSSFDVNFINNEFVLDGGRYSPLDKEFTLVYL